MMNGFFLIKELEKENQLMKKSEFKTSLAKELLKIIANVFSSTRSINYQMQIKSNNIYFTFHRYGEDFHIYIFKNGNVQFKFKEFCHEDFICDYYQFEEDENHEEFIKTFKKDCKMLLKEFVNVPGFWHVLLDYLSYDSSFLNMKMKRNDDQWIDNFKKITKDCGL